MNPKDQGNLVGNQIGGNGLIGRRARAECRYLSLLDEILTEKTADPGVARLRPLIHSLVNPYGSFKLDMEKRLPLDATVAVAV